MKLPGSHESCQTPEMVHSQIGAENGRGNIAKTSHDRVSCRKKEEKIDENLLVWMEFLECCDKWDLRKRIGGTAITGQI